MRFDPSLVGQMSVGLLLVQLVDLSIIESTDDSQLLDCDDAFRSGCRNASQCHHKQRVVEFLVQGNNKAPCRDQVFNPLGPNCDEHLTSPYNVTVRLIIQVTRMKKMITQDKMS